MTKAMVYTTSKCVYCVMLKNFLDDQGIPYEEVHVDQSPDIVQKLVEQTGKIGVPQTELNGKWIVGYYPNQIMAAAQVNDQKS